MNYRMNGKSFKVNSKCKKMMKMKSKIILAAFSWGKQTLKQIIQIFFTWCSFNVIGRQQTLKNVDSFYLGLKIYKCVISEQQFDIFSTSPWSYKHIEQSWKSMNNIWKLSTQCLLVNFYKCPMLNLCSGLDCLK